MHKFLSVIIPCRNEKNYIQLFLDSVINNDYPKEFLEILIVDGISQDGTREILNEYAEKHPYIKILDNPFYAVPNAMNIGIKHAIGDYIVRLDAHAVYPAHYLSKLLEWSLKLDADNVGAICVTQVHSTSNTAQSIKFVMSDKFGVGNSLFRIGINEPVEVDTVPFGFYKREVFEKNGLYDERLLRVQDLEFNKRLKKNGGKIVLIPDVQCIYFARETYKSFFNNRFLTGKWVILAAYLTNSLKSVSIRHLVPLFFVVVLVGSFFLTPISKISGYIFFVTILIYTSILATRAYSITKNFILSLHIVVAYFILHFSYGFGSLVGALQIIKNKIFNRRNHHATNL